MSDKIHLTNKELIVLKLLRKGKNNKEIASEMKVSINTTKTHLSHLFQKLKVNNRIQAFIIADKENLI